MSTIEKHKIIRVIKISGFVLLSCVVALFLFINLASTGFFEKCEKLIVILKQFPRIDVSAVGIRIATFFIEKLGCCN